MEDVLGELTAQLTHCDQCRQIRPEDQYGWGHTEMREWNRTELRTEVLRSDGYPDPKLAAHSSSAI